MNAPLRPAWIVYALSSGAAYFIIARLSTYAANQTVARPASWVLCFVVYGLHIWFEHARVRSAPRTNALRVAVAVAIGAFALAIAGMMHSMSTPEMNWNTWLLALVLFPVVTAGPAFLGALVAAAVLRRYAQ